MGRSITESPQLWLPSGWLCFLLDYRFFLLPSTLSNLEALLIIIWSPGLEGANEYGAGPALLQWHLVSRLKRGNMTREEEAPVFTKTVSFP